MVALALALVLCAAPEGPAAAGDTPAFLTPDRVDPDSWKPLRTERSFLIPAIEAAIIDCTIATYNNLGSRQVWAQISLQSIASHLPLKAWYFDSDDLLVNQFGHPYQGSLSFIAARSSGLNFWWSLLYPFTASLAWEEIFEIDNPSVNDQITTTLGGAFLGEVLFRIAALILDPNNDLPPWLREVLAFPLAPASTVNRALFDDRFQHFDLADRPWFRGSLGGGTFVQYPAGIVGGFVSGRLIYGAPTQSPDAPFSHFDMRADLSFTRTQVTGDFNLRGLLWGKHFHVGNLEGAGGVFGAYEYVAPRVLRASSVNLGGGALAQYSFSHKLAIEATAVASGIVFGAGGFVGANAIADNGGRDYHIGPGFHEVLEVTLVHEDLGMLSAGVRRWNFFGGVYTQPSGHDAITYFNAAATFRIGTHLTGTVELVQAWRDARFGEVTVTQSVTQGHFFFSWLFSDSLQGVVADERHPVP